MNTKQFYTYLDAPHKLNELSLFELEEIIAEYPYFQTAHLLYLKILFVTKNIKFSKQLKISSSHIANREILYSYINNFEKTDYIFSENNTNVEETDIEKPDIHEVKNDIQEEIKQENVSKPKDTISQEIAKLFEARSNDIIDNENNTTTQERQKLSNKLLKKIDEKPKHILDFEKIEKENQTIILDSKLDDLIDKPILPELTDLEAENFKSFNNQFNNSLNIKTNENQQENESEKQEDFSENKSLIDAFIKAQPKISKPKSTIKPLNDASKDSISDNDDFITETLATIYINQKHYDKAIEAYEKLSLKFPQKSIYFARRIEKIRNLKQIT